jgi:probable F420-dependent oxidoreductase
VEFGLSGVCTDESLGPGELARIAEESGLFDSLFFGEHTHIPARRETPFPGGDLPRDHCRTLDPFIALTAAACATTTLRLGTAICLLVERDPIICAKEVASLDRVSGGRTILTVGGGWNLEEMRNHGTDPRTRFALLRERVEAMRLLWTDEEASYHGRFVEFDRIWSWPKPLQEPSPPVWLAGTGPKAEARVLDYGDGWAPIDVPGLADRIAAFVAAAGERERDLPVTVFFYGVGTPQAIEDYARAGASRCVFWLTDAKPETVHLELEVMHHAVNTFSGVA